MTRLVTITNYDSITDELRPFVEFQAAQKTIEVKPDTRIALLQVENIPSYFVVFLDSGISLDEVIDELAAQDLRLPEDLKNTLAQALKTN
jgi:hypothetical protein